MADRARETYADPATTAVLLAAEQIHEQVYEMDRRVSPPLQAVFLGLAEAVYQWHESQEVQDENESEGIRAGAVADLADPTFAANYAASVHGVIAAAEAVRAAVAADGEPAVSPQAAPMLRSLELALDRWQEQAELAATWRDQGARPSVLQQQAGSRMPEPPETPPPGVRPPTDTETEGDWPRHLSMATEGGDDGDSAARLITDDEDEEEPQWESDVAWAADDARQSGAHQGS